MHRWTFLVSLLSAGGPIESSRAQSLIGVEGRKGETRFCDIWY